MRCLRNHSSFMSAHDLFGPQEIMSFIAVVTNARNKIM